MKNIWALSLVLVTSTVFANTERKSNMSYSMPAIEVGFKWASADIKNADSNKQVIGYQVGGSTVFDISGNFGIKTGLFYNERPFESNMPGFFGTSTFKGKITYFDIPVLLMFKFEDYAGVYVGPAMSLKLSDEATGGKLANIKGSVVPIIVGAQFKFAPNLGANIYFESVSGEIADTVSNSRAVGANLMITFD